MSPAFPRPESTTPNRGSGHRCWNGCPARQHELKAALDAARRLHGLLELADCVDEREAVRPIIRSLTVALARFEPVRVGRLP